MHAFLGLSLADLGLIFAIAVLDGLLSIDNALVNAAQAQRLPRNQQRQAIILGLALGALFRVAALAFASWIIHFPLLKLFGAVWLFWLVTKHFVFKSEGEDDQPKQAHDALFRVIVAIGVTDMAFSIDNVVAAVAMSPSFIIVTIGVLVSILVMMFATQLMNLLMQRYTRLESAAYVVIGGIAVSIIMSDGYRLLPFWHLPHYDIPALAKFCFTLGIVAMTVMWEEADMHRARVKARKEQVAALASDI